MASLDGKVAVVLTSKLDVWDSSRDGSPALLGSVPATRASGLYGLAVSADHRTAVAGVDSGTVALWDISDPARISQPSVLPATRGAVSSVGISADNKYLAAGGSDSTVQLWDLSDRTHPTPYGESLAPSGTANWNITFHPKTNYLIGTADQGILRLWDLDPGRAEQRICTITRATIATDLHVYLPGQRLPPLCN
ncbi:WD40 repeat domain-containing protein [Nocardia sp. NPDC088792]|uniref:WD40 repeat domain-containing protein n=1 Tax=Nocardia sp. NPDC088792 TaxID=3364332 RepID=UPI0037FA0267